MVFELPGGQSLQIKFKDTNGFTILRQFPGTSTTHGDYIYPAQGEVVEVEIKFNKLDFDIMVNGHRIVTHAESNVQGPFISMVQNEFEDGIVLLDSYFSISKSS